MDTPRRITTESGDSLEYRGRLLYSRTDPRKRPVRVALAVESLPETLYLVPSPLLWHGVAELARRIPDSSAVLAVEADPVLGHISSAERANKLLPENIGFRILTGEERWPELLASLPGWPFRRVVAVQFNGGYAINRALYDDLRKELERTLRIEQQNRITRVYFARRWMKNLFSNLADPAGIVPYSRISTPLPVVVAGAGESLEGTIDEIARRREEIFLLAADTALPCLTGVGIIPDAAVVLESQFINMRDFYGVPTEKIDLIADLTAWPGVFRLPWRRRFAFFSLFSDLEFLRDRIAPRLSEYLFPAFGSVGVAGAALARAISGGQIYTAGIDFCYRFGKSHARGTQFETAEQASACRTAPPGGWDRFLARPLLRRPGKRGTVLTDLILMNYADAFTRLARHGRPLFDLNPDGLELGMALRREIAAHATRDTGMPDESPATREFFGDLVEAERGCLERLYEVGIRLLNGSDEWDSFYAELATHDYLWAHFPERIDAPPRDPVFLKRLLIAVEGYRHHLAGLAEP